MPLIVRLFTNLIIETVEHDVVHSALWRNLCDSKCKLQRDANIMCLCVGCVC
jgi:hypothetical protein